MKHIQTSTIDRSFGPNIHLMAGMILSVLRHWSQALTQGLPQHGNGEVRGHWIDVDALVVTGRTRVINNPGSSSNRIVAMHLAVAGCCNEMGVVTVIKSRTATTSGRSGMTYTLPLTPLMEHVSPE
jgi:hypothetical protein